MFPPSNPPARICPGFHDDQSMDTYSHVLPDMQDSAVDAMEAALATIS